MSETGSPDRLPPPDQAERDAATTHLGVHLLLDAGAGSGKTSALVARYLRILAAEAEGPALLDRIAAITFTNKAAQEMRSRLRGSFTELLRRAADPNEVRAWRGYIRRLETAPIQTIHALCTSLLRQFPFAADVDPRFEVLNDLDTTVQLPRAIRDSLLLGLQEGRATAGLAVGYYEGLDHAVEALRTIVSKREKYRCFLDSPPDAASLLAQWGEEEARWVRQALDGLLADPAWEAVLGRLSDHADVARASPEDKLSPAVLNMHDLATRLPQPEAGALAEWMRELEAATKTGNVGTKAVWGASGGAQAVRKDVKEVCAVATEHLGPLLGAVSPSEETAELAAAIWQEARHALDAWQGYKAAVPALDYDDLQIAVRDLLRDNDEVRAQVQGCFRHILVDEFQDTSALQWEIIQLLSGREGRGDDAGRLFLVGDAKQSIYRFRDADVTAYNGVRRGFGAAKDCEVHRLSASFRPNAGLMAFFNAVFPVAALLSDSPGASYEAWYEPMQAIREATPVSPPAIGMLVADGSEQAVYRRLAEGAAIARLIRALLADPPLIVDHSAAEGEPRQRPLRAGDIAVLFRAMTQVHLYEDQLWEAGIPYYNATGRGFFGRPEVTDILNVLRVLANPEDAIALVGVLRSPLFCLSDQTLFWLAQDRDHTWWERLQAAAPDTAREREPYSLIPLEEMPRVRRAAQLLASWRRAHDRFTLSGLIRDVVERTGYSAAMAAQAGGLRAVANLGKLTDLARSFEQSGRGGVAAFAEFLLALTAADTQEAQAPTEEEESESVRLTSVHGAKGLQWPVVIVADLGRGESGSDEVPLTRAHPRWGLVPAEPGDYRPRRWRLMGEIIAQQEAAEAEAEDKRVLYVAMTRASDLLVLSSSFRPGPSGPDGRSIGSGSWLLRLLAACGIETRDLQPGAEMTRLGEDAPCPWYLLPPDCDDVPPFEVVLRGEAPEPVSPPDEPAPEPLDFARALRSFPPDTEARQRFAVTELADYLTCPRYYFLRHVEALPDVAAAEPALSRELSPIERGTLAHRLLQMIGKGGLAGLDELLGPTIPGGGGLRRLTDADQRQLRRLLEWFLAGEFYARHLRDADRLRTEAWVCLELDGVLVEGKVDAVAEAGERMTLVDYKTGRGRTGVRDEGEPDANRFQIALYSHGLERVLGRRPDLGALVYLADERIDEIETAAAGPEAARQARDAIARIRGGQFPPMPSPDKCSRCRLRWACGE